MKLGIKKNGTGEEAPHNATVSGDNKIIHPGLFQWVIFVSYFYCFSQMSQYV